MEGLVSATPFARMVGEALSDHKFTLLDVGCSSGIDPVWRIFGKSLLAFGFDPNIDEIERLSASEAAAGVSYIPVLRRGSARNSRRGKAAQPAVLGAQSLGSA